MSDGYRKLGNYRFLSSLSGGEFKILTHPKWGWRFFKNEQERAELIKENRELLAGVDEFRQKYLDMLYEKVITDLNAKNTEALNRVARIIYGDR